MDEVVSNTLAVVAAMEDGKTPNHTGRVVDGWVELDKGEWVRLAPSSPAGYDYAEYPGSDMPTNSELEDAARDQESMEVLKEAWYDSQIEHEIGDAGTGHGSYEYRSGN